MYEKNWCSNWQKKYPADDSPQKQMTFILKRCHLEPLYRRQIIQEITTMLQLGISIFFTMKNVQRWQTEFFVSSLGLKILSYAVQTFQKCDGQNRSDRQRISILRHLFSLTHFFIRNLLKLFEMHPKLVFVHELYRDSKKKTVNLPP